MAAQVFVDEELERLRGFPEIGRDELFRFFTLTPADVAFQGCPLDCAYCIRHTDGLWDQRRPRR